MITPLTDYQLDFTHRHQWISEAAFYKAMSRDFESGFELDDWLFAEREFINMLMGYYFIVSKEDGGLTLIAIKRFTRALGIEKTETYAQKKDLILAIQKITQINPCYDNYAYHHCNQDEPCLWRNDCKKLTANHI